MSFEKLLEIVRHHGVTSDWKTANGEAWNALFGSPNGRYPSTAQSPFKLRAPEIGDDGVPYVAYIESSNPDSGQYGGMSVAIFPVPDAPCLVTFVVGTHGLAPDEQILGRPGHARKVQAICRWLNQEFPTGRPVAWAKQNPVDIDQQIPEGVRRDFAPYKSVFDRYGKVLYGIFATDDDEVLLNGVTAFFDLMMQERRHVTLATASADAANVQSAWMRHLLPALERTQVVDLLRNRRFAVIQGPPGTGKTRMARQILDEDYHGNGTTIQFHPNTTYESFVGGLAPAATSDATGFRFVPTPGSLVRAAQAAAADPSKRYLLAIDEINRADLAKVLGEAIYLLEPNAGEPREIELPYEFENMPTRRFSLPENLDILGTMNTADRSLAILDVAIRRRFAFRDLWPQSSVVDAQQDEAMSEAFSRLLTIFVEHATEDAFDLVPGHSYFLTSQGAQPSAHLTTTLVPLLKEYLAQGYTGGFAEPLRSYMQWVETLENAPKEN